MAKIIIYTKKDYEGEFNLLKNEKTLITRAFKQSGGDTVKMAALLDVTEKVMMLKIVSHFGVLGV